MRFIKFFAAAIVAVTVSGGSAPASAAMMTWCLGLDNNKNLLSQSDCPLVTANEVGGNLEVWVTTQSDVHLEQFGIQWDGYIDPDATQWENYITDITIVGGDMVGDPSADGLTWLVNTKGNGDLQAASMDGFGTFDVVFNLDGQGSNNGIPGTGDGATFAALYFVLVGGSLSDFGVSFGPNCDSVMGCIQAAKISSEQLGYAGGYVSNVPLPGAVWLFLSALAGLFGIGFSRRRAG